MSRKISLCVVFWMQRPDCCFNNQRVQEISFLCTWYPQLGRHTPRLPSKTYVLRQSQVQLQVGKYGTSCVVSFLSCVSHIPFSGTSLVVTPSSDRLCVLLSHVPRVLFFARRFFRSWLSAANAGTLCEEKRLVPSLSLSSTYRTLCDWTMAMDACATHVANIYLFPLSTVHCPHGVYASRAELVGS